MQKSTPAALRNLPSVDEVLRTPLAAGVIERFGRPAAVAAVRSALAASRVVGIAPSDASEVATAARMRLEAQAQPNLRPVFNLTGTVLHTNLGRALLAEAAVEAATMAMRNAVALEFDLGDGKRGDRDDLVRDLLCELTGAEDATVVNNNAAAVLLVLNTLAKGREAIVSRGESIEIGGAFRMPEIMSRAGAKLTEVGTTNRTHKKDYVGAIGPKTGLVLKVHTSNYRIEGFTKEVGARELAALAHERKVPLVIDLGKIRLAALEATLKLYRDPDRLAERLPTMRLLARPKKQVEAAARRLLPVVAEKFGSGFEVAVAACASQIGSGALPMAKVPSAGLAIRARGAKRGGRMLAALSIALRQLPVPVIGRIDDNALILDLRCLDDETGFVANLATLELAGEPVK
ncbi:MAG: L-seryl-tRNA(Sec) selenium transferase [Rhizobiales bacterium]|nr:L-seryl-tRNA(Sec) selenium transferase [Hyphomicrobiales bacterium]